MSRAETTSPDENLNLGSLGAVISKDMSNDNYLPDWLEQGVESTLRDSEEDAPPAPTFISSTPTSISFTSSRATPIVLTPTGPSPAGSFVRQDSTKGPWTDLDKFYDDTNEEEEDDEEEEEESEEGEEEGEDDEEEEAHDSDGDKGDENSDQAVSDDEEVQEAQLLHNTS